MDWNPFGLMNECIMQWTVKPALMSHWQDFPNFLKAWAKSQKCPPSVSDGAQFLTVTRQAQVLLQVCQFLPPLQIPLHLPWYTHGGSRGGKSLRVHLNLQCCNSMLIFLFVSLQLNSLWRLATILSVSEKTTSQSRCAEHMVTNRSSSQAKLACEIIPKEGCLIQKIIYICSCCLVDWKKKKSQTTSMSKFTVWIYPMLLH